MPNRVGQRLGNYRLLRMIGRGGFAEVYLGEHVFLRTQAAIKVLQIQLAKDDMESFITEARTIAALVHPHIIRVLEFGIESVEGNESEDETSITTIPFLVMDYALHGTLRQRHPKGTRLPLTTILTYTKQIAEALHYAHEQKLVHRDLKPENMLVGRNNEILLSDFGIALVSHTTGSQSTQATAGTIAYMAPEQILGKPRPASDQYSLGIVVYEWLCGVRPFYGSFPEIATQHMYATPASLREKDPTIPPAVEEVVMTALRKDPPQRFANVKAFSNALEQASGFGQVLTSGPTSFIPQISGTFGIPSVTLPASEVLNIPALSSPSPPPVSDPAMTPPIAGSIPTPRISETGLTPPVSGQTFIPPASGPIPTPSVSDPMLITPSTRLIRPPDAASGPVNAPQQGSQLKPKRRLSRRAIIVGLPGLVVIGGGVTAWLLTHWESLTTAGQQLGIVLLTYRGHTDGVTALAWSPDSKRIASGSSDHSVQVWDPVTGNTLLTRRGYSGGVSAVAWSPDSTLVASASSSTSVSGGPAGDKTVQVWNATNGQSVFIYRGHSGGITAVAWSPKDMRIVSSSVDFTVQVWDATTGKHPLIYHTRSWYVWTVAWSPDGTRFASGSPDGSVQVWDATTAASPRILRGHTDAVESVAWSPDDQFIASASDDLSVRIWDAITGNTIHTLRGHSSYVRKVAWSPDSKRIASGSSDKTVQVWDATSGKHIYTYEGHVGGVTSLAWSPDSKRIASGSSDKTVQVWKAN